MPIYEYRCVRCSGQFELLILSNTVVECPACRSVELERLISGFAVSSEGTRQGNLESTRRKVTASGDYRERKKAESESITASIKEHGD